MKKTIIALLALSAAASVFAQGTIVYYNRVTGSIVAPVYAPEAPGSTVSKTGNTTGGFPAGTQTYAGAALAGTGFTAQLWAGAEGTAEGSLAVVPGSNKDFRTGGFAGAINNSGGVIAIPGVGEGSKAALQLRVWDNAGGTITSYDNAVIRGKSPVFTSLPLGLLAAPPNMVGLLSFNIYTVPEPSTFALLGLGALGMLVFRRK
jgi:hypothetical protein